jgi:hypothetical protein
MQTLFSIRLDDLIEAVKAQDNTKVCKFYHEVVKAYEEKQRESEDYCIRAYKAERLVNDIRVALQGTGLTWKGKDESTQQ